MTIRTRLLIAAYVTGFALSAGGQTTQPAQPEKAKATMAGGTAALPDLEKELKRKEDQAAALQKIFHHTSPELAFAEFLEMDKLMRLIDIDIAGVTARLAAIKELADKYSAYAVGPSGAPAGPGPAGMPGMGRFGDRGAYSIDRRRVDQDIEMAGLLARRKAAESNRDKAKQYCDLLKAVAELKKSIADLNTQRVPPPQTQPGMGK